MIAPGLIILIRLRGRVYALAVRVYQVLYQVLIHNRTVQYCTVIPCGTYVSSTVLVCGVMMRCEVEEEGNVQVLVKEGGGWWGLLSYVSGRYSRQQAVRGNEWR